VSRRAGSGCCCFGLLLPCEQAALETSRQLAHAAGQRTIASKGPLIIWERAARMARHCLIM
jgi:hypothetical protein